MKPEDYSIFREYAWNYFSMHADQRLRTFNFYLTLSAVLIGAFAAFAKEADDWRWLSLLPLTLSFMAFTFWQLEKRNKQLVRNGEAALRFLDEQKPLMTNDDIPHVLHILARDDFIRKQPQGYREVSRWSYSTCINAVFIVFGVGGLLLAVVCLATSGNTQ